MPVWIFLLFLVALFVWALKMERKNSARRDVCNLQYKQELNAKRKAKEEQERRFKLYRLTGEYIADDEKVRQRLDDCTAEKVQLGFKSPFKNEEERAQYISNLSQISKNRNERRTKNDINVLRQQNAEKIETMQGHEYEEYCGKLLTHAGWFVSQTKRTGDQGADLIACVENRKLCIQCKRQQKPVGVKAVQEALAGKAFYDGTDAVVVSNSKFTKPAQNLANKVGVILIGDTNLEDL